MHSASLKRQTTENLKRAKNQFNMTKWDVFRSKKKELDDVRFEN